jgi:hypothetical protein
MAQAKVTLTPERLAEVDEAMWLRAREGDVAAAKVIYARWGEHVAVAPEVPILPPSFDELKAMFLALQHKGEKADERGVLDDAIELGVGTTG